jgi:HAD superfamily hydrolase (TIGR01509 family)
MTTPIHDGKKMAESDTHLRAPAAVLWDMDGTLVDTEPYWIASEFELAERHGGTWTRQHALNIVGKDLLDAANYMRQHAGIDLPPERIVEEMLDGVVERVKREVPWRPGARALLDTLRSAGIPCALVTMSYRRFVDPILAQLEPAAFQAIVTGEMVERGKPHPDPYLTAAAALGVAAGECLAIEDSPTGAMSAESAGCSVLVIPNHVTVAAGPCRVFRNDLVGVSVQELGELHATASRATGAAG